MSMQKDFNLLLRHSPKWWHWVISQGVVQTGCWLGAVCGRGVLHAVTEAQSEMLWGELWIHVYRPWELRQGRWACILVGGQCGDVEQEVVYQWAKVCVDSDNGWCLEW